MTFRLPLRLGLLAASALALLSLIPQARVWLDKGHNWQGSYAAIQGDEWAYSAYVNALRDGRARRNDPFAGDSSHLPESIFSVQFIPAYAIALPARILGVSTSTGFIASIAISAFFSSMAVFWLIGSITGDSRTAAAGALFVLCFGALIIGQGVAGPLVGLRLHSGYLPFLRRYEPAVPFPLLFAFCALTWRAFTIERRWKPYAITAGGVLAVLIFSYFYLWTAALAWLVCFSFAWLTVQGNQSRALGVCGTIAAVLVIPLLIYGSMIRSMGSGAEAVQIMTVTRALDFFRPTEVLGALVLLSLGIAWRKRLIEAKDPAALFVASCALTPFAVFNQQIITGRSLQPFHYEVFAVNYLLLTGAVVLFYLLARARRRYATILAIVAAVSLAWGAIEMAAMEMAVQRDPFIDEAARVGRYLETGNRQGLILSTESKTANVLPTFAPQPVLWAQHHPVYYTPRGEYLERFYQYLYFTGYDRAKLRTALLIPERSNGNYITFRSTLLGHEREFPHLGGNGAPVQLEDVDREVDRYSTYISRFSRGAAERFPLAYVVTPAEKEMDLSNLDRWYNRDSGERIGHLMLYRVRLR